MPFGIMPFTRAGVTALKHAVRDHYPQIKSSHVDEALAYAIGFDTYAAMLPVLDLAEKTGELSVVAKPDWFIVRLTDLGYDVSALRPLHTFLWGLVFDLQMASERNERARVLLAPKPANDG
ncbi:hypothetical protein PRN20_03670 [Devosia sp. ZB163]|uniref:hypothetical protein n=1 Tax=Devosia sp. ZB163 TaxID=3025938 RepID=UPI00235FCE38|nr:hypothetical protein [Devosia sp. ZB163]MDC9822821.1 hypothetical protein [Devosia sp. ZB163]